MNRRGLRFLLAWCLALLATAACADGPVPVPAAQTRVAVWPGLRIVVPDRTLEPQQAFDQATADGAARVDNPERVFGRATKPYWAALSLHNAEAAAQTRLLAMEATTQFDTRLYRRNDAGGWDQVSSLADAAGRHLGGGTAFPVWSLELPPEQTVDLLIRIEGPAIVRFPVYAYQPGRFAERGRNAHLLMGGTLGACLLTGLIVWALRRLHEDKSVPLFIGMLVADMVGASWLSGFLSELLPAVPEATLSTVGFAGYAMLSGLACLHAAAYLNTAAWSPRIDRLLRFLCYGWVALAPWFALAFPVAARVLLVAGGMATAVIVVAVSVAAMQRRVMFSVFIAGAWAAYLLVSMAFFLARFSDSPAMWSPNTLALVQACATAIFFGLAMGQRLLQQRDELTAAQQEAAMQREKDAALMRERSLFFAATAHDLRQPLAGVGMFANLLKSSRSTEEHETFARKLEQALGEVNELLVSIQQLAAVNEVSHRPKIESAALDDLLAPIVEEYRQQCEHKRITLRYVPAHISIATHVPYFQRIFRNILSNAIRYTNEGDRVLVGCRRGGGLRVVVADTGRGMSEEQARQVFEAFQRFDAESSVPDGFGLGLFSAKSLARALALDIRLRSHKGQGSEFAITGLRTA